MAACLCGVSEILTALSVQLNRKRAINTGSSIRLAISAVIIANPLNAPK
jgi:hypothetical protein